MTVFGLLAERRVWIHFWSCWKFVSLTKWEEIIWWAALKCVAGRTCFLLKFSVFLGVKTREQYTSYLKYFFCSRDDLHETSRQQTVGGSMHEVVLYLRRREGLWTRTPKGQGTKRPRHGSVTLKALTPRASACIWQILCIPPRLFSHHIKLDPGPVRS